VGTDRKTITDSNGSWAFEEVASGTYDIELTKEGYTKRILENISFAGPGVLEIPFIRIGRHWNTTAILSQPVMLIDTGWSLRDSVYTVDSIRYDSQGNVRDTLHLKKIIRVKVYNSRDTLGYEFYMTSLEALPSNAVIYLAIFVSSSPGIDATDPKTYSAADMGRIEYGYMGRTIKDLRDLAGKEHGPLYVRGYIMGCGFSTSIDYETQHTIYHGVGQGSEEYKIELP
jgi:hypothetical protein